jgi:hypothetical protein
MRFGMACPFERHDRLSTHFMHAWALQILRFRFGIVDLALQIWHCIFSATYRLGTADLALLIWHYRFGTTDLALQIWHYRFGTEGLSLQI